MRGLTTRWKRAVEILPPDRTTVRVGGPLNGPLLNGPLLYGSSPQFVCYVHYMRYVPHVCYGVTAARQSRYPQGTGRGPWACPASIASGSRSKFTRRPALVPARARARGCRTVGVSRKAPLAALVHG